MISKLHGIKFKTTLLTRGAR